MLELPTRACLQSAVVLVDSESQCWHAHPCGRVTACIPSLWRLPLAAATTHDTSKRGRPFTTVLWTPACAGDEISVACRKRCLLGTIDTSGQLELFPPTGDFRVTL